MDHSAGLRGSIQGQLLRLSAHHTVAIYLREGALWVADFIDGHGKLVDASTWFRFNCGLLSNSHALRRMTLESAMPLSRDLVASIEGLHRAVAVTEIRWGADDAAEAADLTQRARACADDRAPRPGTTSSRF